MAFIGQYVVQAMARIGYWSEELKIKCLLLLRFRLCCIVYSFCWLVYRPHKGISLSRCFLNKRFSVCEDDVLCAHVSPAASIHSCSFPYTYKGGLYHQCLSNMTEIQPCGCLGINANPAVCQACSTGMIIVRIALIIHLYRDYNCDSTTIRLRSDYDVSPAPASNSTQAKNEHVSFSS